MQVGNLLHIGLQRMNSYCFAPETMLWALRGCKLVGEFQRGDAILSGPEWDVTAPPSVSYVEEVFEGRSPLVSVRVGGKTIRTTAAHQFYVRGKGWVPAKELDPGDLFRSHDGQWVPVQEVVDTGEESVVYNLRVSEYHTYFVGGEEWGFSVWAHNSCVKQIGEPAEAHVLEQLKAGKGPAGLNEPFEVVGSVANGRGNGIDVVLKTESGKYVFVETKAAARYVSEGSGFNKFQRSFNEEGGGGGPAYMRTQMERIVNSYETGRGQYQHLRTGGDYLTGEQAAQIHQAINKQGGYGNVDVYVARVNNVTSQQVPGTNTYQYTGSDPIQWVPWGTR